MSFRYLSFFIVLLASFGLGSTTFAQSIDETSRAVVLVTCDGRQGSGTVINGDDGYVLTDGHVPINVDTLVQESECEVGFANSNGRPTFFYHADIVHAVFNPKLNQDFAMLKIGEAIGRDSLLRPFPFLKTNEFTAKGDAITLLGYSGTHDHLVIRTGKILDFISGFIRVDAVVSPGDSGGAGVDANGNLFGVPTRIVTETNGSVEHVYYELEDIRAVMNWLDTFGKNAHDIYFTHADFARYHQTAVFITQTSLGCSDLGRTVSVSSVYCMMSDGTRMSFPLDKTFFSWFSDFSDVETFSDASVASLRLVRNVTYKPGTLIKSATGPSVYVVVDVFGTIRKIPSEQKASDLWGPAWAGLVFDIPDEFWTNYTIGQPLDS